MGSGNLFVGVVYGRSFFFLNLFFIKTGFVAHLLLLLVLYVITQCVANEICCINKRALLWSFCILTDSLIIVKHCTRLHIQKNYANMPFVLRSGLYLTVQEMPCLSIVVVFIYNTRRMTVVPSLNPNSPMEQSGPIQLGSQLHSPVSGIKAP